MNMTEALVSIAQTLVRMWAADEPKRGDIVTCLNTAADLLDADDVSRFEAETELMRRYGF